MVSLWTAAIAGSLLIILNGFHLTLGFRRLQHALATEPIPPHYSEALRTAWLYLGAFGFGLGCILLWLVPNLSSRSAAAWKAVFGIGCILIAAGIAAYFATRRHPGLLFLSVLGLALVVPLLLERAQFSN